MVDDTLLPIWQALSDPKRRQIVNLLTEKPRTTGEISDHFDVTRFAVMKHLKVLEAAELITVKREGRKRWNILNTTLLQNLQQKPSNGDTHTLSPLPVLQAEESVVVKATVPVHTLHIEHTLLLSGSPDRLFAAWTEQVDAWWPYRTYVGSRICMEPVINGRFYESFGQFNDGALLGTVSYIKKDEELRLEGPMGIADRATISRVSVIISPHEEKTSLYLTHHIFGEVEMTMRDVYTRWWHTLLHRHLKVFIEEGNVQEE